MSYEGEAIVPYFGSPVLTNETPYSQCLSNLSEVEADRLPVFTVGQVADKTGQLSYSTFNDSTALTQGVSEMIISALYKTKKVILTERLDIRVPIAEQQLFESGALALKPRKFTAIPANFVVLGALTELNYNIMSDGARLFVGLIGGGVRRAVINVGIDLRLVDVRTLRTIYVSSLQKQVIGFEVEAGVYRFFGSQLVEFDAGKVKNEPLQLGVRSVIEMAIYNMLVEGLKFPSPESNEKCKVINQSTKELA
ncbi:CsgG/HfaB family protein [Photobacterium ganghwense]|uniref:CsgG/HfaB family protein n=1 Tax=Photobacterium ganghwense TaxID=320778 RepID=UPI001F5D3F57|nr:CsgG/HfaB family protein [Photobacterium ganghwense]